MSESTEQARIRDPEDELYEIYEARIKPLRDLGETAKVAEYEEAWKIARSYLKHAREHKEDHAS